ncbi:MAG: threonine synthase [Tissierellia bacterium]|nr:threonine synthase [Tissierellia bacterium]
MDIKLICTSCGEVYKEETNTFRCTKCDEPLELELVSNAKIKAGNMLEQSVLERYSEFYPFLNNKVDISLGEGFTPLLESRFLSKELGIKGVYFKNESQNPTWSFKDRGTITGVIRAMNLGFKGIGTVSTGNMAASVAAYGSKAKIDTIILVKEEIADEKLKPIAIYGSKLVKVIGDYGKLYLESIRLGYDNGFYFINSDSPFRVEGYKTIAYEIFEQLDYKTPDYVLVPTSAGGDIRGIEKGFRELKACGLTDKVPRFIATQATGCAPIATAFKNGKEEIERFNNPRTIAHAIENPYPPSGNQVLRMLKNNGGMAVDVDDDEILNAQKLMAEEGIFGQPASATSLAALIKLKEENYFSDEDIVVNIVTASGLKFTSALDQHALNTITIDIASLADIIKK